MLEDVLEDAEARLRLMPIPESFVCPITMAGRPFGRSIVPRAGRVLYKFPSETREIFQKEKCNFPFPSGGFRSKI